MFLSPLKILAKDELDLLAQPAQSVKELGLGDLDKLKSMKAGTFAWKGKAKDYPGALNIKQGMTRKGKPKLRIV